MKVIYYILLVTFTYYSIKKVTSLYYYITLLATHVILCNLAILVTELPLKFTYKHVCKTLFLKKTGLFEAEYAKGNIFSDSESS